MIYKVHQIHMKCVRKKINYLSDKQLRTTDRRELRKSPLIHKDTWPGGDFYITYCH